MTEIMVADNLAAIRDRMAAACLSAGRPEDAARLVAVTKRIPVPLVVAACRCGQIDLGENRLPEAVDRQTEIATALEKDGYSGPRLNWHFIGHIQSRKAVQATGRFALLHGVDTLKLAEKISRQCVEIGRTQAILLEVNISGEKQKQGISREETLDAVGRIMELPQLNLQGFMGMARFGADPVELHASFGGLRILAEEARRQCQAALPELSMGMSGDFDIAIAEGATLVRVGTAIFGPRLD